MKKAMILAAGRGERMGALTAHAPKPLIKMGGRYLIEYVLASLKRAGFLECVINISWQGDQIRKALGDGTHYGLKIMYSEEPERLETGGGIFQALPMLGTQPFLVMSSDIITDYPLKALPEQPEGLAHIVLVTNPSWHPEGDYGLQEGKVELNANQMCTYANMGVFRPELFANCVQGHFRLTQVLNPAIASGKVTGEHYQGAWHNIGIPADIERAQREIRLRS